MASAKAKVRAQVEAGLASADQALAIVEALEKVTAQLARLNAQLEDVIVQGDEKRGGYIAIASYDAGQM